MTRIVDTLHQPPAEWFTEIPDWYRAGNPLGIHLDGDDRGRVCGEVLPPPGGKYIGEASPWFSIPEAWPDETFADFHVRAVEFRNTQGDMVPIAVGSIAISGGHKIFGKDLSTAGEVADWLQRSGQFKDRNEELFCYGHIRRATIDDDARTGALIFLGSVYSWTTVEDAEFVNTTTMSADIVPHPEHDGRLQFIGVSKVQRTALQGGGVAAVAAELDPNQIHVFVAGRETPEPEPEPEVEAGVGVAAAMHEEPSIAELQAEIDRIRTQQENDSASALALLDRALKPEDIGMAELIDSLKTRLSDIEDALDKLTERVDGLTHQQDDLPDQAQQQTTPTLVPMPSAG